MILRSLVKIGHPEVSGSLHKQLRFGELRPSKAKFGLAC